MDTYIQQLTGKGLSLSYFIKILANSVTCRHMEQTNSSSQAMPGEKEDVLKFIRIQLTLRKIAVTI